MRFLDPHSDRRFMPTIAAAVMGLPVEAASQRTLQPPPAPSPVRPGSTPAVLLISIDGLRPEYVIDTATFGGRLPNLRRMVRDGSYATGVRGVGPSVTYPSHTTLITGVAPAVHGIIANTTFDPQLKNHGGWYWYASDIRVQTLWGAAAAAGLRTANVHWPVSVGAPITFNLPQYWRAGTADDRKLNRLLATPGLLDRLESDVGPYADGADESIAGDEIRGRFAVRLLESERPRFMTAYFTALDREQHEHGPLGAANPTAMRVLERIDAIIGKLSEAARRSAGMDVVVAVVSDHGFVPTSRELDLLPLFHEAGLIETDSSGTITSWRASIWAAGGSVAVVLKDREDQNARRRLWEVVQRLSADSTSGIARVIDARELATRGAFPSAELLVALRPGYTSGTEVVSTVIRPSSVRGMHGYWPDVPEMRSAFFVAGPGVPPGSSMGEIDMRAIAPTLAALLGVNLPAAEQRTLIGQRAAH